MKTSRLKVIAVCLMLLFGTNILYANVPEQTPEELVSKLYDLVTFNKNELPDWDNVKALFLDEALVVLRTSRTENKVFSLDGFINEFKVFIEDSNVETTGFSETVLKTHGKVFGDIAWFMVLYEAQIPGTERKNLGVDHFSLAKTGGEWKIVSIINKIPTQDRPVPEELRD
ncbi:hypothetical protein [uncultured Draconibacterium sp.]|uniref:hypothetical protein n=1 Tax=uncultured Draconibacterium sp. TaxID=1573823 RepID=UPI003216F199